MKIAFLIPSKDGGEDYFGVLESIERNVDYAFRAGFKFEYKIIFSINGDPTKPLSFLRSIFLKSHIEVLTTDRLGKVRSINLALEQVHPDFLVISDDDVTFSDTILTRALQELTNNKDLQVIGFESQAIPYPRRNIFKRFSYDIINIRSLKNLFEDIDPFLMGRLLVMRKTTWNVPDEIINEDQYLSLAHNGKYKILKEKISYEGTSSFRQHIRRVLRLEAGRKQLSQLFKGKGTSNEPVVVTRIINKKKLASLNLYYRICYHLYGVLRFFTNKFVPLFMNHKTNYW